MKRKLALLILTLLLSVSYVQAQKTDVWDFGATQLDTGLYNNQLDVATINAWYPGTVTVGSLGNVFPSTFTSGILSWTGGTNDRLRTTNLSLTRFDANIANVPVYTGRLYCNAAASFSGDLATLRYLSMTLAEDDEITIIARCDAGTGELTFAYVPDVSIQKDIAAITSVANTTTEVKFVAKNAGVYRIYDTTQKASFYRISRKAAVYVPLSGSLDVTQAPGIPTGYSVLFTNPAGKSWNAPVVSGTYSVSLPAGYTYQMSLLDANGYIISNGDSLAVSEATTSHNIVINKIDLFTVSGSITGLGADISKLSGLTYTPNPTDNKIFVPEPVIDIVNSTYTVELEPNVQYTVSAQGVNDYQIPVNTITVTGTTTADVGFTAKPTYPVTITTTGLEAAQINSLTLTFTNLNESGYVYTFNPISGVSLRNGTYAITYSGLDSNVVVMTLTSNLTLIDAPASKTLDFVPPVPTSPLPYEAIIYVGTDKTYKTINAALAAVTRMTRASTERVTIMIDPGNYEEMIDITQPNVTFKNAAATPNINLLNKGVDIDAGAVRITSYYGHGYNYYSMKSNQKWDADVLRVNKENGYLSTVNIGAGTATFWNATVVIGANGFEAEDIIFENSYNQYISLKESQDVLELGSGNKGVRSIVYGSTAVQDKAFVERAAAIAIKDNIDKVILNKCRVVGRQDSFFGGKKARVVVYKGVMMGATDFLFGGMNVVFYQTDLAMNTSDPINDICFITAAQQEEERGYLMYECKVTSAIPLVETASTKRSKPGYFGRPWQANTSEVVFYNTTIETTDFTGSDQSLILPAGWSDSLNGSTRSTFMYEYGSIEQSGVDNTGNRADWTTFLPPVTPPAIPTLLDGTEITTFNFTKGSDNWDPIPELIANDPLGIKNYQATSSVTVYGSKNKVVVSNVISNTKVYVYGLNGALLKTLNTDSDTNFDLKAGVWIVVVKAADGQKAVKVMTY